MLAASRGVMPSGGALSGHAAGTGRSASGTFGNSAAGADTERGSGVGLEDEDEDDVMGDDEDDSMGDNEDDVHSFDDGEEDGDGSATSVSVNSRNGSIVGMNTGLICRDVTGSSSAVGSDGGVRSGETGCAIGDDLSVTVRRRSSGVRGGGSAGENNGRIVVKRNSRGTKVSIKRMARSDRLFSFWLCRASHTLACRWGFRCPRALERIERSDDQIVFLCFSSCRTSHIPASRLGFRCPELSSVLVSVVSYE